MMMWHVYQVVARGELLVVLCFHQGVAVCLEAMRKAFPATENLQRTTKFFYSPTFRQSEAGIPIGPNSSTPASSRHMLNLYTTPAPAFEVPDESFYFIMYVWQNTAQYLLVSGVLFLNLKITFNGTCVCSLFQVQSEKDTLYLHLLFALKDPSVGTLESNFASTIFYAFSALQVFPVVLLISLHCAIIYSSW